jgi:hypothetical protein
MMVSCLTYTSTLKMVTCASETVDDFQWTTWNYIQKRELFITTPARTSNHTIELAGYGNVPTFHSLDMFSFPIDWFNWTSRFLKYVNRKPYSVWHHPMTFLQKIHHRCISRSRIHYLYALCIQFKNYSCFIKVWNISGLWTRKVRDCYYLDIFNPGCICLCSQANSIRKLSVCHEMGHA